MPVEPSPWLGVVLQDTYRLVRSIGEGGMGTVYEGVHVRLNNRVAVKVMARELASNREALERFRREAEITSQLGHPHIVHVFDFGTAPTGEPYLVMELLQGEDLDHRIRRVGRLPLAVAAHVVKQAASALAATHAKGIVHRDLKPANLFVLDLEGESDFVKVVDFGISKVRSAATKLTRNSVIVGSPNFMSPEQAQGKVDEVDHRTDQWALACITWEMLAGRSPFLGDDLAAVLYCVIHEEPAPLATKVPGIPAEVETVLRRALSKRKADRFPTVTAFARSFADAATARPVLERGEPAAPVTAPTSETIAYGSSPEHAAKVSSPAGAAESSYRQPALPTTLSQSAAEITRPDLSLRVRFTRTRVLVGAAGLVVVLVGIALMRSGSSGPTAPTAQVSAANTPAFPVATERASTPARPPGPVVVPLAEPAIAGPPLPATPEPKPATKPVGNRLVNPFITATPSNAPESKPPGQDKPRGTRPGAVPPPVPEARPARSRRRVLIEDL
jgi:serine/threonine-protein kinase